MTKQEATKFILKVLKNPMMVVSPSKLQAMNLATEHKITVIDLILEFEEIVRNV
jgi:hypothetical protein